MKKILLVVMMFLFTFTAGILSACGENPYDKISIELSDKELTIFFNEEIENGEVNIGEISSIVNVPNDKVSSLSLFTIENQTIASIEKISREENKTIAKVKALSPGSTKIIITSAEGNKTAFMKLNVVLRATAMSFSSDFSLALAIGESRQLDKSFINFAPIDTTQTNVRFSLGEDAPKGVVIDENNVIKVSETANTGKVTLIAKNFENPKLTASTEILIYKPIDVSNISVKDVDTSSVYSQEDIITIARNSQNNSKQLHIDLLGDNEYQVYLQSMDKNSLVIERQKNNKNSFTLTGIETGSFKAKLSVGIKDYKHQKMTEMFLNINIIDIVNSVFINGSNQKNNVNIYDIYTEQSESVLGTKISYFVNPKTSTYKDLIFNVLPEDKIKLANLQFSDSLGNSIPNIDGFKTQSNSFIRVKATQGINENITLRLYANSNFEDGNYKIYNEVQINIKKGIESIEITPETNFLNLNSEVNEWKSLPININGVIFDESTNIDLSQLSVRVGKSSVLDAKIENNSLMILPKNVGESTVRIYSVTGVSMLLSFKVVVAGVKVKVDVDQNLDCLAQTKYNMDTNLLNEIKANIGAIFNLRLIKSPQATTVWDLNFVSSKNSVATINTLGLVRANTSGVTKITLSGKFAKFNEDGLLIEAQFEQSIELQVFKQITDFSIGTERVEVYDVNTIGYLDAYKYSNVEFDAIISEAYIKKDEIRYYIMGSDSVNNGIENNDGTISYVDKNGFLVDNLDGTAVFTARISNPDTLYVEVKIVAVVEEFDRRYESVCTVVINKAKTIKDIYLTNYDARGIYFRAGDGLNDEKNSFKVTSTIYPFDAVNDKLYYIAWDYDEALNNDLALDSTCEIVEVNSSGVIIPKSVGMAKVRVLPRSVLIYDENNDGKLSKEEIIISAINYKKANPTKTIDMFVRVADGTLENPYLIYNTIDFLKIANGLSHHYVLASTIDLAGVELATMGNESQPFTGSLSGKMNVGGKTIQSKILNIRLNSELNYKSGSSNTLNYGLFGVIKGKYGSETNSDDWAFASIRDLDIEFSYARLNLSGELNDQTINFGALSGSLQGKISNVNIKFINNSKEKVDGFSVSTSTNENLILGGICGHNESFEENNGLENLTVSSVIENSTIQFLNSQAKLNLKNNRVAFGGIVGKNDGEIIGNSKFIQDSAQINENGFAFITFDNETFDVDLSVDALFEQDNPNSFFGGICGENNGKINNIASKGVIKVINNLVLQGGNIGGIVGVNSIKGVINDVMSAMELSGNYCVGGIVGTNLGSITLARYEVFDKNFADPRLVGNDIIGGVVGQNSSNKNQDSNSGIIKYTYFEVFKSDAEYFAIVGNKDNTVIGGVVGSDINGNIETSWSNASIKSNNGSVGGFAGKIENTKIMNSYAKARICGKANIGGFIGESIGNSNNISNTYSVSSLLENDLIIYNYLSKGSLNAVNSVYLNNIVSSSGGAVGKNSDDLKNTNTYQNIGWEFGMGLWERQDEINGGYPYLRYNENDFLSEAPSKIEIVVKETVENKFLKVDNKKAILFMNNIELRDFETNVTIRKMLPINIKDLINVRTTPDIKRSVPLDIEILEGENLVQINNGVITPLAKGLVILKIVSQYNADAYDVLQLYLMPGVSDMKTTIDNEIVDDNSKLSLRKGSSKEIVFNFSNKITHELNIVEGEKNNQVGIVWSGIQDYAVLNNAEQIGDDYFVSYDFVNILNAKKATNSSVKITANGYVEAIFKDSLNLEKTKKCKLPWLVQTFDLSVYNGVSGLDLSKTSQIITPNEKINITAILTTDLNEDCIKNIYIKDLQNNILQTIFIEKNLGNYEITQKLEGQTQIFNFKIINVIDNADSNNELLFNFEITPTTILYDNDLKKEFTLDFYAENLVDTSINFTDSLAVTVLPQPILKLSMLHFPNFTDGNIESEDVSSNTIACGNYGLLKINVYPYFANADYLEIKCPKVLGNTLSFSQQAYDMKERKIVNLSQGAELIDDGIKLRLISGYDEYGKAYFNGDLWIKTLLNSDVPANTAFTINVKAFKNGEVNNVFEQNLTLYSQFAPSVKIEYPGNYANQIALGTSVDFDLDVSTIGGKVELAYQVFGKDNKVIENFDTSKITTLIGNNSYFNYVGQFVGKTKAKIFVDLLNTMGNTIEITATLHAVIENIPITRYSKIKIKIAPFVVKNVYIENANMHTLDMAINRTTNLIAKAEVEKYDLADYSETNISPEEHAIMRQIDKEIQNFEINLTKNSTVWYRQAMSEGNVSTDILFSPTGEDLVNYSYALLNNRYVLYGKKISTSSVIKLKVKLAYKFVGNSYSAYVDNDNAQIEFEYKCNLNIMDNSTEDNPTPIYDLDGFINMTEGVHYILMNNIILEHWIPMKANFDSLDGNGKLIQLNSFDLNKNGSATISNIGIFTEIKENTIVKNIIIDIRNLLNTQTTSEFDFSSKEFVQFGLLCGQNDGIITNCEVMNINHPKTEENANSFALTIKTNLSNKAENAQSMLGGLVGRNNGYITNSRVGRISNNIGDYEYISTLWNLQKDELIIAEKPIYFDVTSNFGGLVGLNKGVVSSSYVDNVFINNTSIIGLKTKTAGFIAVNEKGARISSSYASGYVIAEKTPNLVSFGNVGGFVLENYGEIKDCYSDFLIKTPASSAGFIFKNDGTIKFSYTLSRFVYENNEDGEIKNNSSFRAFTGVSDFNEVQNDGIIEYCYYQTFEKDYIYGDEPAVQIASTNIAIQDSYIGFAFTNSAIENGIWIKTPEETPQLVSANQVAVSIRESISLGNMSDIYTYAEKQNYEKGTKNNPMLISSAEKFNEFFKIGNGVHSESFVCDSNIRLIRDLDFSKTSETAGGLNSSLAIMQGTFDGNGMNMSEITLTGAYAQEKESENNGKSLSEKEEFGLFARLDSAVVKNLKLSYKEVSATEYSLVGSLAGVAVHSQILGVDIDSEKSVVQGRNIVGGLIGLVVGNSQIQNIASNISTRATYRNAQGNYDYTFTENVGEKPLALSAIYSLKNIDKSIKDIDELIKYYNKLLKNAKENKDDCLPNTKVSYAGGIIGACVMGDKDKLEIFVRTLKVYGQVQASAERTGGVIGYVSKNCFVYDLTYELAYNENGNYTQSIAGLDFAGGLIGENRGCIDKSKLDYAIENKDTVDNVEMGRIVGANNLFVGESRYQGGIVGKNIYGEIMNVYSRANVVNQNSKYVGGISGFSVGGRYTSIYTTGDLLGKEFGGAFTGYLDIGNDDIREISNNALIQNYSFETIEEISKINGFKLGAFAGDCDYKFKDVEFINSNQYNFSVMDLSKNVKYKNEIQLPYIANTNCDESVKDKETETQKNLDAINQKVKEYNLLNSMINSEGIKISYDYLVSHSITIFSKFQQKDWVLSGVKFPLLKINHKQTAIIINNDNKNQFGKLLAENLNGYFIVTVDVNLNEESTFNSDVGVQGTRSTFNSVGEEARPFKGSIVGRKINGDKDYPNITLYDSTPMFGYLDGARIFGLKFSLPTNGSNEYKDACAGIVATNVVNSSFREIQFLKGSEAKFLPSKAVNDKQIFGGMIGVAENSNFFEIQMSGKLSSSQTFNYNKAKIGGVVGSASKCKFTKVVFNGEIDFSKEIKCMSLDFGALVGESTNNTFVYCEVNAQKLNIKANVISENLNIGAVTGSAYSTNFSYINIKSTALTQEQTKALNADDTRFSISAVESANNKQSLNVGNLSGYANFVNASKINSTLPIFVDFKGVNANIGGLYGLVKSSIRSNLSSSIMSAKIIVEHSVKNIESGDNTESGDNAQSIMNVGGLIARAEINDVLIIKKSHFDNDIELYSAKNVNVGGLIGKASSADIANYTLENSYAQTNFILDGIEHDKFKAESQNIGGLIGYAQKVNINNSYYVGMINLLNQVDDSKDNICVQAGGIIGQTFGDGNKIINTYSYALFQIKSNITKINAKGFIGNASSDKGINKRIKDSFFVRETAPKEDECGAKGISLNDLLNMDEKTLPTWEEWVFDKDKKALPYLKGSKPNDYEIVGSIYSPIVIDSETSLLNLNTESSYKHYILSNDIVINNQSIEKFNGVINGNGKTITLNRAPYLFGEITNHSVVTNLNININFEEKAINSNVGALANINNGFINYVGTSGNITINNSITDKILGGICAINQSFIGQSQSFVNITLNGNNNSNSFVGGICGVLGNDTVDYGIIVNSFSSGDISMCQSESSVAYFGGICGKLQNGAIDFAYVNGILSPKANDYAYGAIYGFKANESKAIIQNVFNDKYATLIANERNLEKNGETITLDYFLNKNLEIDKSVWDFYANEKDIQEENKEVINYGYPYLKYHSASQSAFLKCGNGDENLNSPIRIKSQSGLCLINYLTTEKDKAGKYFVLEKDFACIESGVMIINFKGKLSGQYHNRVHSIKNLSITDLSQEKECENWGFIGTNCGFIKDIIFESPIIEIPINCAIQNVGVVAGKNAGTISNLEIKNANIKYGKNNNISYEKNRTFAVGGAIGLNGSNNNLENIVIDGITFNLRNTKTPGETGYIGGMVGLNNGSGGIIKSQVINEKLGTNANKLQTLYFHYIGGFVGFNNIGQIEQCLIKGVESEMYVLANSSLGNVGGFVGITGGYIKNSYTTMNMNISHEIDTGSGRTFGGFAGQINATTQYCYSTSKMNFNHESEVLDKDKFHTFAGVVSENALGDCRSDKANIINEILRDKASNTVTNPLDDSYYGWNADIWDITSKPPTLKFE